MYLDENPLVQDTPTSTTDKKVVDLDEEISFVVDVSADEGVVRANVYTPSQRVKECLLSYTDDGM